jgi:hypothetical protein
MMFAKETVETQITYSNFLEIYALPFYRFRLKNTVLKY